MSGTEQEQNGLTDTSEDDIFNQTYLAILGAKTPEIKEEDNKPEETVEETTEAAAEPAATEEAPQENKEEQPSDPLKDLPENVRNIILQKEKELEAARKAEAEWRQRYKSDEGRIAALQRQKQEYERALRERQATSAPQQTKQKVEETEEWKILNESDPALARLFTKFAEETTRKAEETVEARVKAATEPLYQDREQTHVDREETRLRQMVPNLDEVVSSEMYTQWYNQQPESIQRLASSSADEACAVLKMYAADMERVYGAPRKEEAPPPTPAPSAATDKITQERQRKVQVQGVQSKVVAPVQEVNEDAIFKQTFAKFIQKR